MILKNLDNRTIFKKAFTNKEVFENFVKEVLGFEVKAGKIETEKQFELKIGRSIAYFQNIDFSMFNTS